MSDRDGGSFRRIRMLLMRQIFPGISKIFLYKYLSYETKERCLVELLLIRVVMEKLLDELFSIIFFFFFISVDSYLLIFVLHDERKLKSVVIVAHRFEYY